MKAPEKWLSAQHKDLGSALVSAGATLEALNRILVSEGIELRPQSWVTDYKALTYRLRVSLPSVLSDGLIAKLARTFAPLTEAAIRRFIERDKVYADAIRRQHEARRETGRRARARALISRTTESP